MNVERAAEIIAAYGGDAARWPATERDAALQLVEADAGLAQARREASALDVELSGWSQRLSTERDDGDQSGAAAARVLAARPQLRPTARPAWQWAIGTGMAAAIVAGVFLASSSVDRPHTLVAHSAASDAAAFAMVFTPTPDEDGAI